MGNNNSSYVIYLNGKLLRDEIDNEPIIVDNKKLKYLKKKLKGIKYKKNIIEIKNNITEKELKILLK